MMTRWLPVVPGCGSSGIFMTRKVLGSLSEISRYSAKPMKMNAEQENDF